MFNRLPYLRYPLKPHAAFNVRTGIVRSRILRPRNEIGLKKLNAQEMFFPAALAVAAVAVRTSLASVSPQPTTLVGIEDKNMFLSQHNWAINSTVSKYN